MNKFNTDKYKQGYFSGGSNNLLNLIMGEDETIITVILHICVFNRYHIYLHHPELDITEEIIRHNFYCAGLSKEVK